jgi:hypothetical protein
MAKPKQAVLHLDPSSAGAAFPRIHEGRYEVDPEATGLSAPVDPAIVAAVKGAGVRLLRIGIGCWLPSQDPDSSILPERDWFKGTTLADTQDDSLYNFVHLDKILAVCRDLDVEVMFNFDHMPTSLARPGEQIKTPAFLKPFVPKGYVFPDGVRNAPPADPDVYAAACVRALRHVEESGVTVRYVELWNEPDLPFFYSGTYQEWFAMYRAFAPAIKATGHKVGGPGWAGALQADKWLTQFLVDCRDNDVPMDFYSFHRYDEEVDKVMKRCHEIRAALDAHGFTESEAIAGEWGYDLRKAAYMGTVGNAAFIASCLMQMPAAGVSAQTHILLVDPVKDPSLGRFHGLTRDDGDPNPIYFGMEAFEQFQSTPNRIATDHDGIALAGVDADGRRLGLIITNPSKKKNLHVDLTTAVAVSGTVKTLTKNSFEGGGWSQSEPIELGSDVTTIVLPNESMVVFEGAVQS